MSNLTVQEPQASQTSVDKALRLLMLLSENESLTVSGAADHLGVARSTAHRLLAVLQKHGFAFQDAASRAYGPGSSLLRVGLAAVGSLELRTVARPELEALMQEVGETVHLITHEGPRTFVLDSVESREAVRVSSRIGGSMPAQSTAAGKVLLAQLPPEGARAVLERAGLPARTARTVTDLEQLLAQLPPIAAQGYALDDGEQEAGVRCLAVPVPGPVAEAALSVSGPEGRLPLEAVPRIVPLLQAAATALAGELSGTAVEGPAGRG
jgi:IclR family transcriptional regulator, acetate operon repressor